MRILFTVQGQGRGHLTQAIAAHEVLSTGGHELVGVAAGNHPGRDLPSFFRASFPAPVTMLASPGFIFRRDRGVDLPATLAHAVRHASTWRRSLTQLGEIIEDARPDVVINFFEPLMGLRQALRPLDVPVISAAHQFALLGPRAGAPPGTPTGQWWLRAFIRMVGFRSTRLALSFRPGGDVTPADGAVVVAPPLLRRRVLGLQPTDGDYVLVYVATHGYAESIRAWHARNPAVPLRCFYDRPGAPKVEKVDDTLSFYALDGELFLDMMAGCRAVMCTAGFESVCEAAFLGKPVLMVPLEGHDEQALNALDGERAGVAVASKDFDLDALARLPARVSQEGFRAWCLEADTRLLDLVERVAGDGRRAALVTAA